MELGGDVTFAWPQDMTFVREFVGYWSGDSAGHSRVFYERTTPIAPFKRYVLLGNDTNYTEETYMDSVYSFNVPVDFPLQTYTHFLVYTVSTLQEQTTPVAVKIFDAFGNVTKIDWYDKDLDPYELGGPVDWPTPYYIDRIQFYRVFFAMDAAGNDRSQLGEDISGTVDMLMMPENTEYGSHTHLVLYAKSTLVEQTTPLAIPLIDVMANVSNISFPDFDLDYQDLGGVMTWIPPEDISQVTHYMIYLTLEWFEDLTPFNVSYEYKVAHYNTTLLGNSSVGQNNFSIPADTYRGDPPYEAQYLWV
jgi:hypothetical protein